MPTESVPRLPMQRLGASCLKDSSHTKILFREYDTNGNSYSFCDGFYVWRWWYNLSKGLNYKEEIAMSEQAETRRPEAKAIEVEFPAGLRGGVYSNVMQVTHTREEFIMDFIMAAPPAAAVTARVIMSPGHLKRTIAALQENFQKYERNFGTIKAAEEPAEKGSIGFIRPK